MAGPGAAGDAHAPDRRPGLGKSLLTIDLATKVTRAGGDVLLLSAEDHAGATIRPRAEAAQADLDRLHIVTMRREGLEEGLALPDDAPELDRLIEKHRAKLVVVDPLAAHLPESVNSWRDQSAGQVARPGQLGCYLRAHLSPRSSPDAEAAADRKTARFCTAAT